MDVIVWRSRLPMLGTTWSCGYGEAGDCHCAELFGEEPDAGVFLAVHHCCFSEFNNAGFVEKVASSVYREENKGDGQVDADESFTCLFQEARS